MTYVEDKANSSIAQLANPIDGFQNNVMSEIRAQAAVENKLCADMMR